MNWMPVLSPHDHPAGQDRTGAIPGHPVLAPCAARVPELGALGREEREKKGKEGKEPDANPGSCAILVHRAVRVLVLMA